MSIKLDAIAYRNRSDYRLRRLEHIVRVTYDLEREYSPTKEDKKLMWEYVKEIRGELNASQNI